MSRKIIHEANTAPISIMRPNIANGCKSVPFCFRRAIHMLEAKMSADTIAIAAICWRKKNVQASVRIACGHIAF